MGHKLDHFSSRLVPLAFNKLCLLLFREFRYIVIPKSKKAIRPIHLWNMTNPMVPVKFVQNIDKVNYRHV